MSIHSTALDIHGAAELLGAHEQTVRRMARSGEIPAYRIGRAWRFSEVALRRWVETQQRNQQGAQILVVDDEEAIRRTLGRLLAREGYIVSTAADGVEALECMRETPPDVVILDLKMKGMDGPTTLGEIRRRWEDIPVVILSGYTDSELMTEALRHSPLTVVAKPIEPGLLVSTLRQMLRFKEAAT